MFSLLYCLLSALAADGENTPAAAARLKTVVLQKPDFDDGAYAIRQLVVEDRFYDVILLRTSPPTMIVRTYTKIVVGGVTYPRGPVDYLDNAIDGFVDDPLTDARDPKKQPSYVVIIAALIEAFEKQ